MADVEKVVREYSGLAPHESQEKRAVVLLSYWIR